MELSGQIKLVPARLVLQNGEVFDGSIPDWCEENTFGEVVFTTGMTGYVESITDPSFAGQILTFTFPLIGNYGVPEKKFWESRKPHLRGVILSEISPFCDHHLAVKTLAEWLKQEKIPFMTGVDTRALTKSLRTQGVALGAITKAKKNPLSFPDPNQTHLVKTVSTKKVQELYPENLESWPMGGFKAPEIDSREGGRIVNTNPPSRESISGSFQGFLGIGKGKKKVIVVDCGLKENILRSLLKFPITIKKVPFDYDYSEEEFDGVFISNGPGDPIVCKETIAVLQKILKQKKPIFGICLGAQLLALAIGAKTFKLPYGHRGQNQPCEFLESGKCYLTSQNHGYAIDEESLPKEYEVTFRNLNDSSVEGIAHRTLPIFAVQFHPEAAPGPTDTLWLFEKFYQLL